MVEYERGIILEATFEPEIDPNFLMSPPEELEKREVILPGKKGHITKPLFSPQNILG